jgi:hypothetical protein
VNGGRHGWVALSYFFLGALLGLVVTTISGVVLVSSLVVGGGDVAAGAVLSALVGAVVLFTHLVEGLKRSGIQAAGETGAAVGPPSGDAPPTSQEPPAPPAASGGAPLWPSAVYWRVAALVGLIVAVVGAVGVCDAIASQIFAPDVPGTFSEFAPPTNNNQDLVQGLLVTGVGLLVMWWHLSEARKRGQ